MTIQKYSIYSPYKKLATKIAWFVFVYVIEILQMTQLNVYPTIRKCILVFVFLFGGFIYFFFSFVLKDKSNKEET